MELQFTKPISELSADELSEARRLKLPLHCQTMRRRSRLDPNCWVYSDVEELTRENLNATVASMEQDGWRRDGAYFTRTAK